uniref:Uncharacterized protein n=1 Tax=Parascaris univalens TaxID=6257 RepID=A0A915BAL8_PARUN
MIIIMEAVACEREVWNYAAHVRKLILFAWSYIVYISSCLLDQIVAALSALITINSEFVLVMQIFVTQTLLFHPLCGISLQFCHYSFSAFLHWGGALSTRWSNFFLKL